MNKMLLQMRNMFEEQRLMPHGDMIEQDQMLVQLPHITHVRNYRYPVFAAKQTDGDEFAHPSDPYGVYLYESRTAGLQIVLEYDPVRHVLAQG